MSSHCRNAIAHAAAIPLVLSCAWAAWATTTDDSSRPKVTAGAYVAYSLTNAEELLRPLVESGRFDAEDPQLERVVSLGGMNEIIGVFRPAGTAEAILFGRYNADQPLLTLDDLAVALRSRFVHKAWPLVSIDPPEEYEDLGDGLTPQVVRWEGGIENSRFGMDLLQADYKLKLISGGLLESGSTEVKKIPLDESGSYSRRLWFEPELEAKIVGRDMAMLEHSRMGLYAEVKEGSEDAAVAAEEFVRAVEANYGAVAAAHPEFGRAQVLSQLIGLSKALESMPDRPPLEFWNHEYPVKSTATPGQMETAEILEDRYYVTGKRRILAWFLAPELSKLKKTRGVRGGVRLSGFAYRIESRQASAFRQAVVEARGDHRLTWQFTVAKDVIADNDEPLPADATVVLLHQAVARLARNMPRGAIALCSTVIDRGAATGTRADPNVISAHCLRASAYASVGSTKQALADAQAGSADAGSDASCPGLHALLLSAQGDREGAIKLLSTAIAARPADDELLIQRAEYKLSQDPRGAVEDADRYIARHDADQRGHLIRGAGLLLVKGTDALDHAVASLTRASQLERGWPAPYFYLGKANERLGRAAEAVAAYEQFSLLAVGDPRYAEVRDRLTELQRTDGTLPQPLPGRGLVYVIRPSQRTGGQSARLVRIDGSLRRSLPDGTHAAWHLEPVPHLIEIETPLGLLSHHYIDVEPGKHYFVVMNSRLDRPAWWKRLAGAALMSMAGSLRSRNVAGLGDLLAGGLIGGFESLGRQEGEAIMSRRDDAVAAAKGSGIVVVDLRDATEAEALDLLDDSHMSHEFWRPW